MTVSKRASRSNKTAVASRARTRKSLPRKAKRDNGHHIFDEDEYDEENTTVSGNEEQKTPIAEALTDRPRSTHKRTLRQVLESQSQTTSPRQVQAGAKAHVDIQSHDAAQSDSQNETDNEDEVGFAAGEEVSAPPLHPGAFPELEPNLCVTCYRTKKSSDMVGTEELPKPCNLTCFPHTCRDCINIYLDSYFFRYGSASHDIGCPFCASPWPTSTFEALIGKQKLELYLERMTHRSLETCPTFRWCAQDKCTSGQFFDEADLKKSKQVCCGHCNNTNCFQCRAVWHEGLTCEEYQDPDLRKHRSKRAGETEVRKAMRKAESKRCPHCGTAVEKTDGCNSVHCSSCGQYFDYGTAVKI